MVASDDPGLCKAPFVAGKNVDYPEPKEIEAVEYYLKNYVWGKLQMTEKEKYPYAVYGIDNWKINRDSKPADRNGWTEHVWRVFDYPHVVHLYWNMYRVAKYYPDLMHYLDKDGYLERAFGTAMAYYTVPLKVAGWSADQLGNYDELVIADAHRGTGCRRLERQGRSAAPGVGRQGRAFRQRPAQPVLVGVPVRSDRVRVSSRLGALCRRSVETQSAP